MLRAFLCVLILNEAKLYRYIFFTCILHFVIFDLDKSNLLLVMTMQLRYIVIMMIALTITSCSTFSGDNQGDSYEEIEVLPFTKFDTRAKGADNISPYACYVSERSPDGTYLYWNVTLKYPRDIEEEAGNRLARLKYRSYDNDSTLTALANCWVPATKKGSDLFLKTFKMKYKERKDRNKSLGSYCYAGYCCPDGYRWYGNSTTICFNYDDPMDDQLVLAEVSVEDDRIIDDSGGGESSPPPPTGPTNEGGPPCLTCDPGGNSEEPCQETESGGTTVECADPCVLYPPGHEDRPKSCDCDESEIDLFEDSEVMRNVDLIWEYSNADDIMQNRKETFMIAIKQPDGSYETYTLLSDANYRERSFCEAIPRFDLSKLTNGSIIVHTHPYSEGDILNCKGRSFEYQGEPGVIDQYLYDKIMQKIDKELDIKLYFTDKDKVVKYDENGDTIDETERCGY